MTACVTC